MISTITLPPSRPAQPTYKKLLPWWWLMNADDPEPPLDYMPGHSLRKLYWFARNPFHNLMFYTLGLADKERTITGTHPTVTLLSDINQSGFKWHIINSIYPFISYSGDRYNFYLGWRPFGALGFKFTPRN